MIEIYLGFIEVKSETGIVSSTYRLIKAVNKEEAMIILESSFKSDDQDVMDYGVFENLSQNGTSISDLINFGQKGDMKIS